MKWTKIIIVCCVGFIISCKKIEILPTPPPTTQNIFSVKESRVEDGQIIHFQLSAPGIYTLTLIDKETNQVVSRERFTGTIGENIKKIYTNSLQSRYLYMLLEDVTKTEIGKTTIIIK